MSNSTPTSPDTASRPTRRWRPKLARRHPQRPNDQISKPAAAEPAGGSSSSRPTSDRRVPWSRGVIPGIGIAVGALAVVEIAVLLGVMAGGSADLSWSTGLGLGAQLWLLSLGIPLEVSVAPLAGVQAQTGVVSLAPLGLSVLTAGLAFLAGTRLARRAPYGAGLGAAVLTTAATHALVAGVIAAVTATGAARAQPQQALIIGGLIVVLATAGGALTAGGTPAALVGTSAVQRARRAGQEMRWAGSYIWALLRAATVAVVAGLGLGALILAVALTLGWQQMVTIQQQLGSDAAGDTVFFALHVALLPNFVVWALSWASGAGFYLGQGALVSPAGSSVETLPLLPIFGVLPPQDAPTVLAAAPALVVLCGVVAGWWFVREGENHLGEWIAIRIPWPVVSMPVVIVVTGILIGATTLLLMAAIVALASGSLGVGRMDLVGPAVWQSAAVIGTEVAIGAALGAAVGPWAEQGRAVRAPVSSTPAFARPSAESETEPAPQPALSASTPEVSQQQSPPEGAAQAAAWKPKASSAASRKKKPKPSRGALERDREAQRRAAIEDKQRRRMEVADLKARKRYAAAEKRRQRRKAARDR